MADSANTEPKISSTTPERPSKPASTGRSIAWLSVLLVVMVAAAGAWYWQQNRLFNASFTQQLGEQQQQLNAMRSDYQQQHEHMQQLQAQLTSMHEQQQLTDRFLEQLSTEYQTLVTQMQTLDGRRSADWLVAEADYLVRMAGRKIWLDRDLRTAMMLLGNADERLAQLADPAVLTARSAIAEDLQILRQLNPVSRTAVALSLRGLHAQIDSLPLHDPAEAQTVAARPEQSDALSDWRHNLAVIWQDLLDTFIRVSWREQPQAPLLSQQAQWMVREQLKLSLINAQHAALHAQSALYEQSLIAADDLLKAHFLISDAAVQAVSTGIEQLQRTDVSQPLPTELVTQKHMEQLMNKRVARVFGSGAEVL